MCFLNFLDIINIFFWNRKQGIMSNTNNYFYKGSLRVNEYFQYFTYLLSFKVFKYLQALIFK